MFLHHFEISPRSDDKTELQPTKNRKDKKDTKRLVVLDFIFLSGRHVDGLGSFSASILSGPREIEYLFFVKATVSIQQKDPVRNTQTTASCLTFLFD